MPINKVDKTVVVVNTSGLSGHDLAVESWTSSGHGDPILHCGTELLKPGATSRFSLCGPAVRTIKIFDRQKPGANQFLNDKTPRVRVYWAATRRMDDPRPSGITTVEGRSGLSGRVNVRVEGAGENVGLALYGEGGSIHRAKLHPDAAVKVAHALLARADAIARERGDDDNG